MKMNNAKQTVNITRYARLADGFYDEMMSPSGAPRWPALSVARMLFGKNEKELSALQKETDAIIQALGITFTVYRDNKTTLDRAWPLDVAPRVIDGVSWDKIEAGLFQRLHTLNCFLHDVYHDEKILKAKVVPESLVKKSPHYRPQCRGVKPIFSVWAHICGSDLVRDKDGRMMVLEDNLRVPSGVSYMLENREVLHRALPAAFLDVARCVRSVHRYPQQLCQMLASLSPRPEEDPTIVLLTPGVFNSAYFEHLFLAREMGVALVEPADMVVLDETVYLRTIGGLRRVDVIYRRIDDWFLDPDEMYLESTLGIAGLMAAWRAGNVAIANAPGCGVVDDKAVYAYVPQMIKYYLGEEPLLDNVPTFWLGDKQRMEEVLARMKHYVIKPANESGGYGVVIGPKTTAAKRNVVAAKIRARPGNFVAQPLVELSVTPTVIGGKLEPRHVDLRPFTLQSNRYDCTAGGLTRVARQRGSYIVNSSQGGGSKDTWVVDRQKK